MGLKPGQNSGKDGGIFQEIGPRGGAKPVACQPVFSHILPQT